MANQKARMNRPAKAATKGFSLNAHRTAIIVGLISMVGVLTASAISNWDKLRGNQSPQLAASDTTEALLVYNEQRRALVEGAYDQALTNLQEAEGQTTKHDAVAIKSFAASIKQKKVEVGKQYDKVLKAIKEEKRIEAEIHKTKLNTIILSTQREYDANRTSLAFEGLSGNDIRGASGKRQLPEVYFPIGKTTHKSLHVLAD